MRIVDDILKTNGHVLWSVAPDSLVNNAIQIMIDRQVGALPVLEARNLVGIISAKDCIRNVILKGKSIEATPVEEIMVRNLIKATPAQTVEDCVDVMIENQIRHLPVMADGSLVGFVSMGDLLRSIITDQKDYIFRLENYVMGIGFT